MYVLPLDEERASGFLAEETLKNNSVGGGVDAAGGVKIADRKGIEAVRNNITT